MANQPKTNNPEVIKRALAYHHAGLIRQANTKNQPEMVKRAYEQEADEVQRELRNWQ